MTSTSKFTINRPLCHKPTSSVSSAADNPEKQHLIEEEIQRKHKLDRALASSAALIKGFTRFRDQIAKLDRRINHQEGGLGKEKRLIIESAFKRGSLPRIEYFDRTTKAENQRSKMVPTLILNYGNGSYLHHDCIQLS